MSTTVKTGWLNDSNGDKFAPKTLISQVQTSDGILIEEKMKADLDKEINEFTRRTPYASGKFGIGVWPAHNGYVPQYKYDTIGEIIKKSSPAVTPEEELSGLQCGFYTLYMHPSTDVPHRNSAFRGFCNLTNNGTDPTHPEQKEPYAYIVLVDEGGSMYLRYIAGLEYDSGWNKALMENDYDTIVQEVIKALPVYDGGVV